MKLHAWSDGYQIGYQLGYKQGHEEPRMLWKSAAPAGKINEVTGLDEGPL